MSAPCETPIPLHAVSPLHEQASPRASSTGPRDADADADPSDHHATPTIQTQTDRRQSVGSRTGPSEGPLVVPRDVSRVSSRFSPLWRALTRQRR